MRKAISLTLRRNSNGNLTVYTFSPLIIHQLLKRLYDKREALKILQTNSSEEVFQISKALDGQRVATILKAKLLSEVKLTERKAALLKQNNKEEKEILPFVAQYSPQCLL